MRAVPIEMIRRDVEQHRGLRRELERVFELERRCLADDRRARLDRLDERAERGADVAGDGDRQAGLAMDVADQLRRRRLAVRAGHGDELVLKQPPGELQLAEHRNPALARRFNDRRLRRNARALHERADVVEQRSPIDLVQDEINPDLAQLLGRRRRAGVEPDHALATRS